MTAPLASHLGSTTVFVRLVLAIAVLLLAGVALKKSLAPSSPAKALAQRFVVEREAESLPLMLLPIAAAPLLHVLLAP